MAAPGIERDSGRTNRRAQTQPGGPLRCACRWWCMTSSPQGNRSEPVVNP
jgi:hypothetical protein